MAKKKAKTAKKTKKPAKRPVKKPAKKKLVKKSSATRPASGGKRTKRAAKKTVKKAVKRPALRRRSSATRSASGGKTVRRVKRAVKSITRGVGGSRSKKSDDTVLLDMLLNSGARARILRLLFREPAVTYTQKEIAETCGVPLSKVRKETSALMQMGVVDMRSRGGKKRVQVAASFPFVKELQRLAMASFPIGRETLVKMVKSAGRVKLIIVAGIFMNDPKARVDIIVVADKYSEKRLARAMKKVEQVVAADVRWAGMETKEFLYRWKMFDRFVRDMVGGPHERLVGKVKF